MKRDNPPEFEIDSDVDYDDPREMEWVYRISESALKDVVYEDED